MSTTYRICSDKLRTVVLFTVSQAATPRTLKLLTFSKPDVRPVSLQLSFGIRAAEAKGALQAFVAAF